MSSYSQTTGIYPFDIENKNFLSPIGFKMVIPKMRGVEFFSNQVTIPGILTNSPAMGTRFNKIPMPGDEIQYEDLKVRFIVDENMKNWYQVHDWIREISTPYSSKEFGYQRGQLHSQNPRKSGTEIDNQWRSDVSLFILSSNYQPVSEFIFRDAFPFSLTTLNFDATVRELNFLTAEVGFKYSRYDYTVRSAARATDETMPLTTRISEQGEYIEIED